MLSIAIDVTAACTPKPTGIGRYTEGLTSALSRRQVSLQIGTRCSHFHLRQHRLSVERSRRFWIQEPLWPLTRSADVIHVTDSRVPRWPLLNGKIPTVATLHDVFHILPGMTQGERFSTEKFAQKKIDRYRQIARDCSRIIAVSGTTKDDFLEHIDCDPEKVEVVHHGIDENFFKGGFADQKLLEEVGIPAGGVVYAGDFSQRKNLDGIVEGYLKADLDIDTPLILIGESTYGSTALQKKIDVVDKGRILRFGWLNQDQLAAAYRSSRALLFCTHYEGFGLPILEALACGTPVVISNRGAAPEVAGGHGHLCDANDAVSIAAALNSALGASVTDREKGKEYARSFTWDRCAQETELVYQNAMESS